MGRIRNPERGGGVHWFFWGFFFIRRKNWAREKCECVYMDVQREDFLWGNNKKAGEIGIVLNDMVR